MIVVMKPGSTQKQVEHVVKLVREMGLKDHVIVGTERTVVAVIGNDRFKDRTVLRNGRRRREGRADPGAVQNGVEGGEEGAIDRSDARQVRPSRQGRRQERSASSPGRAASKARQQLLEIAHAVKEAGAIGLRGGAFKPRTNPYSFQGMAEKGLELLALAREQTGLAIVTEVMAVEQVKLVADYADVLQVGARNMQNFNLLNAVGEQSKPVLLKRGMSATLEEFLLAAEYIMAKRQPAT